MSLTQFLGVPYDSADCVALTMRYLRAVGIEALDPRTHPEAWEQCDIGEAVMLTYRERTHVAAIVGDRILETRKGGTSHLMPIARIRIPVEFWRPRP